LNKFKNKLAREMKMVRAHTLDEIEAVQNLFREYEQFLGVDLCFQSFDEELASLPGKYGPPDGVLLIAIDDKNFAGCVALRKLEEGICEMKRLFVRSKYRGQGLGRRLAKQIIDEAVKLGYSSMRLDTLNKLIEAMRLYESLGFKRRDPYYHNPLSGVLYWELELERQKMG
jgi:putative acetyltransferase